MIYNINKAYPLFLVAAAEKTDIRLFGSLDKQTERCSFVFGKGGEIKLSDLFKVCSVVVDIYMFGQLLIGLIAPTGLILIVTQLVGIKYTHWLRFIWPYMLILYVYLNTLLIIDVYIY